MARITVEDCLRNLPNRFSLVRLAAKRAKELLGGKTPVTNTRGNKAIVSALREIAAGKVNFNERKKHRSQAESNQAQLTATNGSRLAAH